MAARVGLKKIGRCVIDAIASEEHINVETIDISTRASKAVIRSSKVLDVSPVRASHPPMTWRRVNLERLTLGVVVLSIIWNLTPFRLPHWQHETVLSIAVLGVLAAQIRSAYRAAETTLVRWTLVYAVAVLAIVVPGIFFQLSNR